MSINKMSISEMEISAATAVALSLPLSTRISHDYEAMNLTLDSITQKLTAASKQQLTVAGEQATDLTDQMTRVMEIYNEDITKINNIISKELKKAAENRANNVSNERKKTSYQDLFNYYKEELEISLVQQRAIVLQTLSPKIRDTQSLVERSITNRLLFFPSLNKLIPSATDARHFEPVLRPSDAEIARKAAKAEQTHAFAAKHCDVIANIKLNAGEHLGFCCAPHWGSNPIAFKKHDSVVGLEKQNSFVGQWSVDVPRNIEWKLVIIQDDKVVKWEEGDNRFCDAKAPTQFLSSNNVRFPE